MKTEPAAAYRAAGTEPPREPPQILYPLRLREGCGGTLDALRDTDSLAARLRRLGIPSGFGRRTVEPHDGPELLEARYDRARSRLVLRWTWLRQWTVQVTGADGLPALRLRREPAISSIVLDLDDGRATLRIPKLAPNTSGGLPQQLRLLRGAVGEVVDLGLFEPVRLEPVIRKLLRSGRVEIVTWAVRVRGGRKLKGDGDPGLLRWIVWRLRRIEGRWLICDWLPDGAAERRVTTKLFAASDRIDLLEPCPEADLERVLAGLEALSDAPGTAPEVGEDTSGVRSDAPAPPPAPVPEHGLLHLVRLLLRHFLSPERTEHLLALLAPWLFAIFYVLAVLGTTWAAAHLGRAYPGSKTLILISYLVCLVPLAALVEIGLGRPIAGRALRMILAVSEAVAKLTSLVAELLIEAVRLLWRRWRRYRAARSG